MINWFTLIKKLMQTSIVIVSGSIINASTVHLNGIWHLKWRYLLKTVLGRHRVLSGHYSIPQGCPLTTGFTVTLNMTKSEFMLIGSRRQKLNNLPSLPSLNVNNIPIKHSQCFKSFGVLIDINLTWENHVDALSKEIAYLGNQDCKLHKWTACAVHLPDLWINKFWPLGYSFATHLIDPVYYDCSMKKQPISTAIVLEFRELL